MPRDLRYRETSLAEIERLSEISPSDAERARERWKELASPPFRALADTVNETGTNDELPL